MPKLVLLAAVSDNGVIGDGRQMPWERIPRDMAEFKRITTELGVVVMGRKTAESLVKPLPGRRNLVLSRDASRVPRHFEHLPSVEALPELLGRGKPAAVIGGSDIYALFAPHAWRCVLTRIHQEFEGNVTFPFKSLVDYRLIASPKHFPADEKSPYALTRYPLHNLSVTPIE